MKDRVIFSCCGSDGMTMPEAVGGMSGYPDYEPSATGQPLWEIQAEGTVRLVRVQGPVAVRSRLASLGFTPGTTFQVLGSSGGACRVQIRDTCVVLDRDTARLVLCEPAGQGMAEIRFVRPPVPLSNAAATE